VAGAYASETDWVSEDAGFEPAVRNWNLATAGTRTRGA